MKKKLIMCLLSMCIVMGCIGCREEKGLQKEQTVQSTETEVQATEESELTKDITEEVAEESDVTQESDVAESEEEVVEEVVQEVSEYDVPEDFVAKKDDVTYGEESVITYDSTTTGTTRKATVVLPAGYSEEKEYPILYLLHGIGGDHNEWKYGQAGMVISNMIATGEAKEMIVVMPNVRARENDSGNPSDIYTLEHYKAFDNFINDLREDLMPFMEENYSVAKGKENTAIAGLSMGGRESLYIGFSMPETFGYIGAFCPAPGILGYTNFGVTEEGLLTPETFTLPEGSDNLVMIVKGESDTVVGEFPTQYHETLEKNGVDHIYYTTPGGHDFDVWRHGLYNFAKRIF